MARTNKTIELLEEIAKTLKESSHSVVLNALKLARKDSKEFSFEEDTLPFIVSKTCRVFKISQDKFYNGTNNDYRTDAHMVCFYLIKKYLKYNNGEIGQIFKKDRSVVSKRISSYANLNAVIPQHSAILNRCKIIDDAINEFLAKNKYVITQ